VARLLLRVLLLVLLAAPAGADVLQDLGATFQAVAGELASAFPKVEVAVAAVEGDTLRVEGPGAGSLRPGLELSVFRRGEPFRHPITNQLLGHVERELGTLVIGAVEGGSARGRFMPLPDGPEPAPGDGARITAGRLPVAVLPPTGVAVPFETVDQANLLLVARFSALLEKTGRFLAVEPDRVLAALAGGEGSSPSALEMSRRLGGVAVLSSRLVREGAARALEAQWISGRTGAALATVRTSIVSATFPPRFAWEETPELARQYALESGVRGLALGDLDGDRLAELAVADEQAVVVHRTSEGKPLARVEGAVYRPGGLILSVDVAPLRGTPPAQLVVVDARPDAGRNGLRARVLDWTPTGFQVVHESVGRHLRVVRLDGEPWLLEQDAGEEEPYAREARRLVWNGARFEDGARLRLPPGVSIFGMALMRLTGGADPEVVALTTEDRLTVWTTRGQLLWTSPQALGGSAVTFNYGPLAGRSPAAQDGGIHRVPGRVIPLDDGQGEILLFENLLPALEQGRSILPRLAATLFNRGRVLRLRWQDGAFVRVWQSNTTTGYIADVARGDLDGDDRPEVLVGVVPRGLDLETLNPFGRGRGRVVAYELP
jgi:hypothetical protein